MAGLMFFSIMVMVGSGAAGAVIPAVRVKDGFEDLRRPDPSDARAMARWLVSLNSWGVLWFASTLSGHLSQARRNVASFSDGPVGNSSGTPYFFLSTLDPTPNDLEQDAHAAPWISVNSPIGTCGSTDVENPTCARVIDWYGGAKPLPVEEYYSDAPASNVLFPS